MRIGGLASGMDVDTLVSDLMKAERIPLDKLKQKKQVLEWQRDEYRSMNTLLLNFRTELMNMKLSSAYRARLTTSSDEAKVSATANSSAALASYSIQSVENLASATSKVTNDLTGKITGEGKKIDFTKSLYDESANFHDQTFNWTTGSPKSETIQVSGSPIKVDLKGGASILRTDLMNVNVNGVAYEVVTGSFTDPVKKQVMIDSVTGELTFNNSVSDGSTVKVDFIASKSVQEIKTSAVTRTFSINQVALSSSSSIQSIKIGTSDYTKSGSQIMDGSNVVGNIANDGTVTMLTDIAADIDIQISYEEKFSTFNIKTAGPDNTFATENFNIAATSSFNSLITKVNDSNVGVTMFYDSASDRMTLTRKVTGDFNKSGEDISLTGDLINNVLKFNTASTTEGKNAIFTINNLRTERTTNTFEISGVTFTLKTPFASNNGPVGINISNNTEQVFENIKSFILKYNELIGKIKGEVQEERYRTYTPLTDEQRETLTDKQQEQWEERAKSGMLRRDPTLSSLLTKMRIDFSTPISNTEVNPLYKQLASIGIKTTSNYLEGGKLEIDEATLKKAIEANPTSVEKLFNATGTTDGEKGIAQRLTDTVNASLDKLRSKAGNSFSTNNQFEIGKLLNDVDTKINRFEERLLKVEDRYWARFTAMEKAIQRSNEQMAQLTSYMS
ncbi:flagellar filament capping protein FliD [Robertmurraya beringensis]|uniref:Flagellar hook-associated protein 2 n=1 Tax=Robertmurraya beringensis TaxID=641660 RepID=A0ABV6KX75_9BACI